jgi:uncharacterized membrane protein
MVWLLIGIAALIVVTSVAVTVANIRAGRDLDRRLDELERQLRGDE